MQHSHHGMPAICIMHPKYFNDLPIKTNFFAAYRLVLLGRRRVLLIARIRQKCLRRSVSVCFY